MPTRTAPHTRELCHTMGHTPSSRDWPAPLNGCHLWEREGTRFPHAPHSGGVCWFFDEVEKPTNPTAKGCMREPGSLIHLHVTPAEGAKAQSGREKCCVIGVHRCSSVVKGLIRMWHRHSPSQQVQAAGKYATIKQEQ